MFPPESARSSLPPPPIVLHEVVQENDSGMVELAVHREYVPPSYDPEWGRHWSEHHSHGHGDE
jgi:hypothetical protein